jgi:hypothetical protein
VGLSRFELLTPRLSSVCSNQLSYRPVFLTGAPGGTKSRHDETAVFKPSSPLQLIKEPGRAWFLQN